MALLLCSRLVGFFDPQIYIAESAFAIEMAARKRTFAVTDDPSSLFGKSVMWFLPARFVSPRLWDYSRQVVEFVAGLERQGNRLFCSSKEVMYWENKAYMHRKLNEIGAPTPTTKILTAETRSSAEFDFEPLLIKEEHSSGSYGVHYFATAAEAQNFIRQYPFRPHEHLLVQELVQGATRDLRLTMVGDAMIKSASFWRIKRPDISPSSAWTTTATTYNSRVEHANIPDQVIRIVAEYLQRLRVRTAGVDVMWVDDDLTLSPLILELSPYYQPNPPKPARYAHWTYKQYKQKPYVNDGYFSQQYLVFREIAGQVLDQGLF